MSSTLDSIEDEAKSSISLTCFPNDTVNPKPSNLFLAYLISFSPIIPKLLDGAIILI